VNKLTAQPENKGRPYRKGELELILSIAPTTENIERLANSLGRSAKAIEIVYRIAYQPNQPFGAGAQIQRKKIETAKGKIGLTLFG
jgi:hypothetical protein